jgi:hypothetical protein
LLHLIKIESKVEREYNLDTHKTCLKEDVDIRIESLKNALEKQRDDLHLEIDEKFDELRLVKMITHLTTKTLVI